MTEELLLAVLRRVASRRVWKYADTDHKGPRSLDIGISGTTDVTAECRALAERGLIELEPGRRRDHAIAAAPATSGEVIADQAPLDLVVLRHTGLRVPRPAPTLVDRYTYQPGPGRIAFFAKLAVAGKVIGDVRDDGSSDWPVFEADDRIPGATDLFDAVIDACRGFRGQRLTAGEVLHCLSQEAAYAGLAGQPQSDSARNLWRVTPAGRDVDEGRSSIGDIAAREA